jgi:hypothetical protein
MDIVEDLLYAVLVGLLGFGAHRAIARGLSQAAKRVAVGLVTAAIVFSLVVVSWDLVDGTSTSTESFIVLIAGVPLLIALAAVRIIDGRRQPHA